MKLLKTVASCAALRNCTFMGSKSLITSALCALFAFAVGGVWGEETKDVPSTFDSAINIGTTTIAGSGTNYVMTANQYGYLSWGSGAVGSESIGFSGTVTGSGYLCMYYKQGNGTPAIEKIALTNANFSSFSGQLLILNKWNTPSNIKLSGDSFANVVFLSPGTTLDESRPDAFGGSSDKSSVARGNGDDRCYDTLTLVGDTTLAGITGAGKGATASYNNISGININTKEFVATESNSRLTLAGSGTYSFNGSVGANNSPIPLTKSGSGTQTFGGDTYLSSVNVSEGTLELSGTANLLGLTVSSEGVLSSSGTLTLSGNVDLAKPISNSGTVTVSAGTVFVLDHITPTTDENDTSWRVYTLINGGTINSWTTLGKSNFVKDGSTLGGRQEIDVTSAGVIKVKGVMGIVWNGTESDHIWNTTERADSSKIWEAYLSTGGLDFEENDNVYFTDNSAHSTVTVGENVSASSVVIKGGSYRFERAGSKTITADTLVIDEGATLTLQTADILSITSIVNNGTLVVESGTLGAGCQNNGTLNVKGNVTFNGTNTGTIDIQSGTMTCSCSLVKNNNTGTINVGANAVLDLGSATETFNVNNVAGVGRIKLASGNDEHSCKPDFSNSTFTGTLEFKGKLHVRDFKPGCISLIELSKHTTYGGSLWGGDSGNSSFVAPTFNTPIKFMTNYSIGDSTQTKFTLGGRVEIPTGITVSTAGTATTLNVTYSGELDVQGTLSISKGNHTITSTATIANLTNNSGGTINISGNATITSGTNAGTIYIKETGTMTCSTAMVSSTSNTGTINVSENATLNLGSGSTSFTVNKVSGDGTVKFTNSTEGYNAQPNFSSSSFSGTLAYYGKFRAGLIKLGSITKVELYKNGDNCNLWAGVNGSATISTAVEFKDNFVLGDTTKTTITLSGSVTIPSGVTVATYNQTDNTKVPDVTFSGALNVVGTLQFTCGTHTISGAADIANLTQSGGTLNISSSSANVNSVSLTGGTMNISGNMSFKEEGSLAISSGTLNLTSSLTGKIVQTGGTINVGATDGSSTDLTVKLNNKTKLVTTSTSTVNVYSGATLDLTENQRPATNNDTFGVLNVSGGTVLMKNLGWGENTNLGNNFNNTNTVLSNGGILQVTSSQASTSGGAKRGFQVTSGTGTYYYTGEGSSYIIDSNEAGHVLGISSGATLDFNVDKPDATVEVSKPIGGEGSLQKTGAGTLIISGAKSYTGNTTVSAGTLKVDNENSLGNGTVTVASDAILNVDREVEAGGKLVSGSGFTIAGVVQLKGDPVTCVAKDGGLYLASVEEDKAVVMIGTDTYIPSSASVSDLIIKIPDAETSSTQYDIAANYLTVNRNTTSGLVEIGLNAEATGLKPTVASMAMPEDMQGDKIEFAISNPIQGLYYAVVSADTVEGLKDSATPTASTGVQATGETIDDDNKLPISIPMPEGNVMFFKLRTQLKP